MAAHKLIGKRVKVHSTFMQSGEQLDAGATGVITHAHRARGITTITVDWTGSSFQGRGWGDNKEMWVIDKKNESNLRYTNNKEVKIGLVSSRA